MTASIASGTADQIGPCSRLSSFWWSRSCWCQCSWSAASMGCNEPLSLAEFGGGDERGVLAGLGDVGFVFEHGREGVGDELLVEGRGVEQRQGADPVERLADRRQLL